MSMKVYNDIYLLSHVEPLNEEMQVKHLCTVNVYTVLIVLVSVIQNTLVTQFCVTYCVAVEEISNKRFAVLSLNVSSV